MSGISYSIPSVRMYILCLNTLSQYISFKYLLLIIYTARKSDGRIEIIFYVIYIIQRKIYFTTLLKFATCWHE